MDQKKTIDLKSDSGVIAVIKGLVMDGVRKANSGHTGGAFSSVDFAYILFKEFLKFDPDDKKWLARDRFVLSAGHESMLLYSLFYLMDWLELDDLKNFRQLHSKTPGHPENFMTPGVECTTGPLGQGAGMSVGFAIAAKHLHAQFADIFTHKTYAILGDGCMQEDVTLGAASLAGHLGLNNLIWYYDRNKAQISGAISRATSDDEEKVFLGFGWQVLAIDGHDHAQIRSALKKAQKSDLPTLIVGDTKMAKGCANMEGDHETHGSPLPAQEIALTKTKLNLPADQNFFCSKEAKEFFQAGFKNLRDDVKTWRDYLSAQNQKPEFRKKFADYFENSEVNIHAAKDVLWPQGTQLATRNAFGDVLKNWATAIPNLIGGSADLEPSNMTGPFAKIVGDFQKKSPLGRNLAFGVREFPMSCITNGIALHGGFIPFDATFLSFSDYSRPALRLGALQKARVIHEFTHDSFHLGEDGPTHQPVEHIMSLRLIPDLMVMRPADAEETQAMMKIAATAKIPSAICLSRQKLPILKKPTTYARNIAKGAYAVVDCEHPEIIILATGSEVALAVECLKLVNCKKVRIISLVCWELFEKAEKHYRDELIPSTIKKRVAIEAGSTLGWQKWVGLDGLIIGLDRYGASAPAEKLAEEYGFVPEKVAKKINDYVLS